MAARTTILILIILLSGCATSIVGPVEAPPSDTPDDDRYGYLSELPLQIPLPAGEESAPEVVYTDLWQRIRDGFAFPDLSNKYVKDYEKWYAKNPEYMARVIERARPYLFYLVEEVEKRGMPTELVLLPAIESAFRPTAYSRAHAVGLWQFIPATAKRYHLKMNWWYDGRRDVIASTRAALDYLEFLHADFEGNWFHALAAYNAGERRIHHAIRKNRAKGRSTNYSNLQLKSETRRYVPKLLAFKHAIKRPGDFGIDLAAIPNQPYFTTVDTAGQIDLTVVQESSGIDATEFRHLNPAFRRWATDPDGPHRLLAPISRAPELEKVLADLPPAHLKYTHYAIKEGDTLGHIAARYGVTVRALQHVNNLRGTLIRAGKDLIIPLSSDAIDVADVGADAPKDNPMIHRVRSGDTLWEIARRYNVYISQLTRWNSIRASDLLHLGQSIVVYVN